jgi:hypothetical protein
MFHGCHKSVTDVLRECYKSMTLVLPGGAPTSMSITSAPKEYTSTVSLYFSPLRHKSVTKCDT